MPGRTARGRRWAREQVAFLAVLAGVAAGFLYLLVQPGAWRPATAAISVVVIAAGLIRLALPNVAVGFLAVRSRWVDALCYFVFGGLILAVDIRLHS